MSKIVAHGGLPYLAFGAGRFELYVHPFVFAAPLGVGLLACLFTGRLSWAVWATACWGHLAVLAVHEAAHAGVAAALGSRRVQVWLGGMGGVCVPHLPPSTSVRGLLLLLSAGWWAQLVLAGLALLLPQLPQGPWSPAMAGLMGVWLLWNGVLLANSVIPRGASDGAQVLAVLRALRAERLSRSG